LPKNFPKTQTGNLQTILADMYKLFFALIFLVSLAFLSTSLFKIKNIEVPEGKGCIDESAIKEQFVGKNIFTVSSRQAQEKIADAYKCAKNMSVQKKYPSTLVITVEADRPLVKLGDKNIYITENGLVLEGQNQGNLPTIFFDKEPELKPGEKIEDDTVVFALSLISQIGKTEFVATSIRILNPAVISVYNRESQAVIFTSEKDAGRQVDSLQLILSESKIDPSKIEKIDLRFEKPVITYKK